MLQRVLTLLFSGVVTSAFAKKPSDIGSYTPYHPPADNSTYGNVDQIYVTHQHVDWFTNWTSQTLQGYILMDFTVAKDT